MPDSNVNLSDVYIPLFSLILLILGRDMSIHRPII